MINMLRLGRTCNTKNYQNEFKTMVSVRDEEIAYIPELYTHEEYDRSESESEPEKERHINVIQDNIDEGEVVKIPSSEESEVGESDFEAVHHQKSLRMKERNKSRKPS